MVNPRCERAVFPEGSWPPFVTKGRPTISRTWTNRVRGKRLWRRQLGESPLASAIIVSRGSRWPATIQLYIIRQHPDVGVFLHGTIPTITEPWPAHRPGHRRERYGLSEGENFAADPDNRLSRTKVLYGVIFSLDRVKKLPVTLDMRIETAYPCDDKTL